MYAEKAKREGYDNIGKEFERIAEQELMEHFMELAELSNLVKSTEENLKRQ